MTFPKLSKPHWNLWAISIPLLIQTVLISVIPLQAAISTLLGKTIILRTVPVDPYDPLRGYYVTLRYDISQRGILSTLDGWESVRPDLGPPRPTTRLLEPGKIFYVTLEAPGKTTAPNQPWEPIAISPDRPRDLPENQIALQGNYGRNGVLYGLERYYLPEADRLVLEGRIREAQTATEQPRLTVEIRVGLLGKAVPIALWIQDERIEF
jgi:uncharacterized membrane-anchored protein